MTTFADLVHEFLSDSVVRREDVDQFLDPDQPKWARFDSELGYVPHPSRVPDGVDGAVSTYRYGAYGERLTINYADRPCRVNSYGDSFTQCHQVSDGETWQEYLAAHLEEPIRNFGVGGYGVYQAGLRLSRTESTDAAAEYVLFNIYLDDHFRNLDAFRMLRVGKGWWDANRSHGTSMFHANPWRHVRFDGSGALVDRPNACPTEESLYQLCDRDFLLDTFADDLVVHLLVGRRAGRFDFLDRYADTAHALGVPLDNGTEESVRRSAEEFYDRCAFGSSILVLERIRDELSAQGKKLLVLLSYPGEDVADACRGKPRRDAAFVRQLGEAGFDYVDSLAAHVADYADFSVAANAYVDRSYNGHYTPAGNHCFAFFVKPDIVRWLQPPPPAYATPPGTPVTTAEHLA
jgi:hypothetical protein